MESLGVMGWGLAAAENSSVAAATAAAVVVPQGGGSPEFQVFILKTKNTVIFFQGAFSEKYSPLA